MEDGLYEIESMGRFAGLELNEDAIPDETTILKFRRFLEHHGLAVKILEAVDAHLGQQGLLRQGTIVDTTIIQARSSTKNRDKQRDPAMRQTKKSRQWYVGMKAHISVDVESGLVHTVPPPANVGDVTEVDKLLHGQEKTVYADAGYQDAQRNGAEARRHLAYRRQAIRRCRKGELKAAAKHVEYLKAAIRSKVEHPLRVIKRQSVTRSCASRGSSRTQHRC
jgi:IS5 family transposase